MPEAPSQDRPRLQHSFRSAHVSLGLCVLVLASRAGRRRRPRRLPPGRRAGRDDGPGRAAASPTSSGAEPICGYPPRAAWPAWTRPGGTGWRPGHWVTFTEEHGLGRGAVSALAAHGDTVWAATLFDSLTIGNRLPADRQRTLLVHRRRRQVAADHQRGPLRHPAPRIRGRPLDTPVENACFGLAVEGDTVWAAFFAGSAVRSTDFGRTWERVLPGGSERPSSTTTPPTGCASTASRTPAPPEDAVARAQAEADSVGVPVAAAPHLLRGRVRGHRVDRHRPGAWPPASTSAAPGPCTGPGGTSPARLFRATSPATGWLAVEREIRPDGEIGRSGSAPTSPIEPGRTGSGHQPDLRTTAPPGPSPAPPSAGTSPSPPTRSGQVPTRDCS